MRERKEIEEERNVNNAYGRAHTGTLEADALDLARRQVRSGII
jgi:hypothetical protein